MYKNLIIKKITAAAMLIVFAVSITPAIVFHDWFANHTDTVKKSAAHKDVQIGKSTINCHCNSFVAESPFTEPAKLIFASAEIFFSIPPVNRKVPFISSSETSYSLRGPPAV